MSIISEKFIIKLHSYCTVPFRPFRFTWICEHRWLLYTKAMCENVLGVCVIKSFKVKHKIVVYDFLRAKVINCHQNCCIFRKNVQFIHLLPTRGGFKVLLTLKNLIFDVDFWPKRSGTVHLGCSVVCVRFDMHLTFQIGRCNVRLSFNVLIS